MGRGREGGRKRKEHRFMSVNSFPAVECAA
jgi:hypothetical protein